MPRDNIDDFGDVLRYAEEQNTAQLIKHLQNPTTIYPEDLEEPITYINGMSAPTTFAVTTEYSPECISKLFANTTGVDAYYTKFCEEEEKTCEVCGEPVDDELGGHLCKKCFVAAKKYRNALTDREVAFGG